MRLDPQEMVERLQNKNFDDLGDEQAKYLQQLAEILESVKVAPIDFERRQVTLTKNDERVPLGVYLTSLIMAFENPQVTERGDLREDAGVAIKNFFERELGTNRDDTEKIPEIVQNLVKSR